MNLSLHFSYAEFVYSETAIRRSISNAPSAGEVMAMRELCKHIMEPLRVALDRPVYISSGYRSPELNALIGGSRTSQHMLGEAVDFHVEGFMPADVMHFAIYYMAPQLAYDQIILEFNRWIHISYGHRMRKEALVATKNHEGETVYHPFLG